MNTLSALTAVVMTASTLGVAQPVLPDGGFERQAREIAKDDGISVVEARRRLRLQQALGDLGPDYQADPAYIGTDILTSRDSYRIITRVRRDGAARALGILAQSRSDDVSSAVEIETASIGLSDLETLRTKIIDALKPLHVEAGTTIDTRNLVVIVQVRDVQDTKRRIGELSKSPRIVFRKLTQFPSPAIEVTDGVKITANTGACTTAFNVYNTQSNERGILTGGHCVRTAYGSQNGGGYASTPLVPTLYIRSAIWDATRDFAWATNSSDTFTRRVYIGSSYIAINSFRNGNPAAGANYCKYGVKTGYSCQNVLDPTWTGVDSAGRSVGPMVQFYKAGANIAQCGDSGGPVFGPSEALAVISQGDAAGPCLGGPYLLAAPVYRMGWDYTRILTN